VEKKAMTAPRGGITLVDKTRLYQSLIGQVPEAFIIQVGTAGNT
jgi:hypothetical protein